MSYGIAEWYGNDIRRLSPSQRRACAQAALGRSPTPNCPFAGHRCSKRGGVCSIRQYPDGEPVITCPTRFEQDQLLVHWLAEIVGFDIREARMAREVGFMESTASKGKPAGKIDMVIARVNGGIQWYGLEVQAVYFSGAKMEPEFELLAGNSDRDPPRPVGKRRPDFRSSGPKRLLPQLQIKAPTLNRWGSKIAVAVDRPFFAYLGGPSKAPSRDVDNADVIWLVPEMEGGRLRRGHWEAMTLPQSHEKLLAAKTINRAAFEATLRQKLTPISGP